MARLDTKFSQVKDWTLRQGRLRTWAYVLIAGGVFLLAANLGLLEWMSRWVWAVVFLGAGAGFLVYSRTIPRHWWAIIPAFTLAALGVSILTGDSGGPLFLGIVGVGFAAVYLSDREHWWALIPAGVLLTLAVVAYIDDSTLGYDTGWLFFLGIAATFFLLGLLPKGSGGQRWALYPALGALGLALVTVLTGTVSELVLPVMLVVAGAFMLVRRDSGRRRSALHHGGS
jgi:hypothetical protein